MSILRSAATILLPLALSTHAAAQGTPLKDEVDGLVRQARGLGAENAKEAATFLVALVHCHRGYDMSDGPVIRAPRKLIYGNRRDDGLFGSDRDVAETTAWVYQALHDLDAEVHAADLEMIRETFAKRFRLKGAKLDAALEPFRPLERVQLSGGVRPVFAKLVETVATQKAEILRRNAPKSESRPWAPFMVKGLGWMLAQQSAPGIWSMPTPDGKMAPEPGLTSLCLAALAAKPADTRTEAETESLQKGITWLLELQKQNPNGAFSKYVPNYVTCAAVLALSKVRGIDVDAQAIQTAMNKARKYLLSIQNVENMGYAVSDRDYGSIGYGGDQRGDLSNTQMAIEALRATGVDVQDEAFAKALIYLRRVQNLPGRGSWSGTQKNEKGEKVEVVAGDDGGAAYYPGVSFAGYDETADGKQIPRSYGSMTYALLKCYVLAGLDKKDPRLQKALEWCFANFDLDVNPGHKKSLGPKAPFQGLYYYYLTLARALALAGVDEIPAQEAGGAPRDWRAALRKKLESLQLEDGSWVNSKNGRWWEASPLLCTAYALLALSE